MASLGGMLRSLLRAVVGGTAPAPKRRRTDARPPPRARPPMGTAQRSVPARAGSATASPGQFGAIRTVEISAASAGRVKLRYAPKADSRPDPGEVLWTWVPYQENDGRGKDRPVLILARLTTSTALGVALTSKSHEGERNVLELGPGAWDRSARSSWARLDRLFTVNDAGMRREGAALDARTFARVARALTARYRW